MNLRECFDACLEKLTHMIQKEPIWGSQSRQVWLCTLANRLKLQNMPKELSPIDQAEHLLTYYQQQPFYFRWYLYCFYSFWRVKQLHQSYQLIDYLYKARDSKITLTQLAIAVKKLVRQLNPWNWLYGVVKILNKDGIQREIKNKQTVLNHLKKPVQESLIALKRYGDSVIGGTYVFFWTNRQEAEHLGLFDIKACEAKRYELAKQAVDENDGAKYYSWMGYKNCSNERALVYYVLLKNALTKVLEQVERDQQIYSYKKNYFQEEIIKNDEVRYETLQYLMSVLREGILLGSAASTHRFLWNTFEKFSQQIIACIKNSNHKFNLEQFAMWYFSLLPLSDRLKSLLAYTNKANQISQKCLDTELEKEQRARKKLDNMTADEAVYLDQFIQSLPALFKRLSEKQKEHAQLRAYKEKLMLQIEGLEDLKNLDIQLEFYFNHLYNALNDKTYFSQGVGEGLFNFCNKLPWNKVEEHLQTYRNLLPLEIKLMKRFEQSRHLTADELIQAGLDNHNNEATSDSHKVLNSEVGSISMPLFVNEKKGLTRELIAWLYGKENNEEIKKIKESFIVAMEYIDKAWSKREKTAGYKFNNEGLEKACLYTEELAHKSEKENREFSRLYHPDRMDTTQKKAYGWMFNAINQSIKNGLEKTKQAASGEKLDKYSRPYIGELLIQLIKRDLANLQQDFSICSRLGVRVLIIELFLEIRKKELDYHLLFMGIVSDGYNEHKKLLSKIPNEMLRKRFFIAGMLRLLHNRVAALYKEYGTKEVFTNLEDHIAFLEKQCQISDKFSKKNSNQAWQYRGDLLSLEEDEDKNLARIFLQTQAVELKVKEWENRLDLLEEYTYKSETSLYSNESTEDTSYFSSEGENRQYEFETSDSEEDDENDGDVQYSFDSTDDTSGGSSEEDGAEQAKSMDDGLFDYNKAPTHNKRRFSL